MNYIWDIAIQAKEDGYKKSDLFWEQGKVVSPYYEQSFFALNQTNITESRVEINALCRFEKLFGHFLHEGFLDHPEFKNYFYDLVIHFLCEIDLGKGISKESIYLKELERDILMGVYGIEVQENYKAIPKTCNVLPLLMKQLRVGASLSGFREALMRIYPDSLVYQMEDELERILIYLGMKKTEHELQKYNFIETMFLPIEYRTKVFWEHHFGVMGVDATLTLGEIQLF
ncbi:MAG: hypothetical protein R3Y24_02835 [Eubacteriales bacterium]